MESEIPDETTRLLRTWGEGDESVLDQLVPRVERELRRIARRYIKKMPPDPTLTTTALVQEAYVRLIDHRHVQWRDRAHFFALCARIMRGILVDHARAHRAMKRGQGAPPVPLDDALAVTLEPRPDLLAIDEALDSLSQIDPRRGRVVELRFFGGLTVEETAEVVGVSPDTVKRDWKVAKLWLMRELDRGASPGGAE